MFIGIIRDLILFNPVGKFLYENVYHCYFILAAYVLFVMWLGPFWMRTRKPFDLKISMIAYNFFMSAFNLLLACQLYTRMTDNWHLKCLRGTPEYYQKFQVNMSLIWNLFFEKYISLIDTIFFVLRKKQHQISFLHVFHHTSMCLFSISFMTIPDPAFFLVFAMCLNTFVHFVMYFYYGLSAFGKSIQKYLWWKHYLTLLQIAQFLLILLFMVISFGSGCEKMEPLQALVAVFIVSMIVLFLKFYQKSIKKSKMQ
ncbi:elongation of very long chain fatty acids protein 4-like isoform X1 [Argiope bruennichi]|uniref:elongation of very long chain fatty acids protein 4-like isoform X1 n=1 Tax=Argiope bruennichi TaxID=94029 RepID=UPI002494C5E3|nr:elongation of very long chain fatty acids protein 4-like isoform X1 [Argiope bruennichi]XP_055931518.1 elongation of very long chain fatty acids protein 4-like isoform X1 [Argiope bruennichi]XP_055931519.1 elongation of very long chain fatty acids protein 4-like isoform X1 [Argiope bruennichi]